jgi:hypothetical protein
MDFGCCANAAPGKAPSNITAQTKEGVRFAVRRKEGIKAFLEKDAKFQFAAAMGAARGNTCF